MNRSRFRLSAVGAALLLTLAPLLGASPATAGPAPVSGSAASAPTPAPVTAPGALLRGQVPAAPAPGPASEAVPGAEPEVSVTEIPVVVPPVEGGDVLPAPEAASADATGDVIVTDELSAAGRVESEVVETETFQTLGLTWPGDVEVGDLQAQVRTRTDGEWTGWLPLEQSESPDAGTADAAQAVRGGTESMWVGDTDAVQLSFLASEEGGPADLDLVLVGSEEVAPATGDAVVGRTQTDAAQVAMSSVLAGAVAAPRVIGRAEWGARAQVCSPDVASTLVAAVVHHTAGPNSYSTVAEAMQQIRNDQRYHIEGRGWCDIGYNFIVDKWGNVYEGRANSSTQPVIGVHAGGFNTRTLGISMLGDYSSVTPPAAVQESVSRVIAWRLGAYHRDPMSTTGYTTGGGENSRYAAGTTLALPVVIGHRDVGLTACPGERGYAVLGAMKTRARDLIGASFVNPALSASSIPMGGSVTVTAGVLSTIDWTLQVTDARTGIEHYRSTGASGPSGGSGIVAWSARTNGGVTVGPGPYRLTLSGVERGSGIPVVPWSGTVEVTGSQAPPTVTPAPLAGDLRFVPVPPARLVDTRQTAQSLGPRGRMDLAVTGRAGIPGDAKAVALNVTTVHSSAVTFLRVWPAGQSEPGASALNTDPARTTGAGVMVGVGGEGKVSLLNNAGTTHVVVDVTGYYTDASGQGAGYAQLATGARVLDTRTAGGNLRNGERRTVQVTGGTIPSGATAVAVNITSVMSTGAGNIAAFPSGGAVPGTASVNHLPGNDVSNRTVVPLDGAGRMDLQLAGASSGAVVDVVGWFGPSASLRFTPIAPVRAFDTRVSGGTLGQGETRRFDVSGVAGLPADAQVAAIGLAATQQTAWATFATVWRDGTTRPTTSDLNTGAGRDQMNLSFATVGNRRLQAYNNSGTAQLIGDVFGYFR